MHWGPGMGYGGGLAMGFGSLFGLVLLAVGVAVLVRLLTGQRTTPAWYPPATPRQVLADRFAQGEIDEPEYLRRVQVLDGAPLPAHPAAPS